MKRTLFASTAAGLLVLAGTPALATTTPPAAQSAVAAQPALLKVTARFAAKKVPATGATVLVRKIFVGLGQSVRVTTSITPGSTEQRAVATLRDQKVRLRTVGAPAGKITVRITATGKGVSPVTFTRTWRIG